MEMRGVFVGLVLAVLGASVLGSTAAAADKRLPLDTGETLSLSWRDGWVPGVAPSEAPLGAVVFHGADAKRWRVMLAPLPPHPTLTGDIGNLRIYVRNMARSLENGGVDVDPEHKTIDGPNAHGFYVKAHDSNPKAHSKSKKDELFSDGYTGAIALGAKVYLFEVVWNTGGEADAAVALAALKTLRLQ